MESKGFVKERHWWLQIVLRELCYRWLRESPAVSSAATLEIDTPTGYHLVESEAENIARNGAHPTLRDALVTHTKTFWFFEQVC